MIVLVLILILVLTGLSISYFKFIVYVFVVLSLNSFVFYEKTIKVKNNLNGNFKKYLDITEKIFTPIMMILNRVAPPVKVGQNLSLSLAPFLIICIHLLLLILF